MSRRRPGGDLHITINGGNFPNLSVNTPGANARSSRHIRGPLMDSKYVEDWNCEDEECSSSHDSSSDESDEYTVASSQAQSTRVSTKKRRRSDRVSEQSADARHQSHMAFAAQRIDKTKPHGLKEIPSTKSRHRHKTRPGSSIPIQDGPSTNHRKSTRRLKPSPPHSISDELGEYNESENEDNDDRDSSHDEDKEGSEASCDDESGEDHPKDMVVRALSKTGQNSQQNSQIEGDDGDESDPDDFILAGKAFNTKKNITVAVDALLDTGSTDNWISEDMLVATEMTALKLDREEKKKKYQTFTGPTFSAKSKVNLLVSFESLGPCPLEIKFYVRDPLARRMVIGKRTIREQGLLERKAVPGDKGSPALAGYLKKDAKKKLQPTRDANEQEAQIEDAKREQQKATKKKKKEKERGKERAEQNQQSGNGQAMLATLVTRTKSKSTTGKDSTSRSTAKKKSRERSQDRNSSTSSERKACW